MTNVEQLKSEIATLEAAQELLELTRFGASEVIKRVTDEAKDILSKLEVIEADPWQKAKEEVSFYVMAGGDKAKAVAEYVRRLEGEIVGLNEANDEIHGDLLVAQERIKELESDLARRPVVWCTRDYNGDLVEVKHGNLSYTLVFPTKEIANKVSEGGAEIYIGEQQ